MQTLSASVRRLAIAASAFVALAGTAVAQTPIAGATPCLQKLQEQQLKDATKKKKKPSKFGKIVGGVVGAAGGIVLGNALCKNKTGADRVSCVATTAATVGLVGMALGDKLDQREQKKVVEASYASAFSGRPQALTLAKGCAMVEPAIPVHFEPRDVQLPITAGITPPVGVLRAVGEPRVTAAAAQVQPTAKESRKPLQRLNPNSPAFVMGSVDNGKWLLLGRGSEDTGYVASGYVPASGWVKQPDVTPPSEKVASGQEVAVKAELPCWTSKITIRSESGKAQQDTVDTQLCRGPDGTTEAPQSAST